MVGIPVPAQSSICDSLLIDPLGQYGHRCCGFVL